MDRVRHLGRFEILGTLATGGMAELMLARLGGVAGFARLVAIKRILPHFARDPDFVQLFCDEARTLARIRHANVVQVHELGQTGDELFLVMEYLEGESVAGVARRLVARGERLDPMLACLIVAEACRGLDFAHTLTDDDDMPLDIVHRDVSPQNLFVTYDGTVKVIDFGIARASDRRSETQPNALRGKLAYMPPEQYAGHAVDKRADVFALTVVLHELLTGLRLFARASSEATMQAVLLDPIPAPTALFPSLPPAVDAICRTGLARARHERYASCAELRRDLLGVLEAEAGAATGDRLAELMTRMFADRVEEKRNLLRSASQGQSPSVPAGEADPTVVLPTVRDATMAVSAPPRSEQSSATPGPLEASDSASAARPASRLRRAALWGAAIGLPVASLSAALVVALLPPPEQPASVLAEREVASSAVALPPAAAAEVSGVPTPPATASYTAADSSASTTTPPGRPRLGWKAATKPTAAPTVPPPPAPQSAQRIPALP